MIKINQKGFTLIELLVVIAIIGILASIVLVSLNDARNKGKDVAIKAALSEARAQAEMYYDANSSYASFCIDTPANQGFGNVGAGTEVGLAEGIVDNGGTIGCADAQGTWAAESTLNSGGFWCVDSTGVSKAEAATKANVQVCN